MKKRSLFRYGILIITSALIFGACGKNINTSKRIDESIEEEFESPKIKYVKEERQEFKNSDRKKEFEELDGFGKYSDAIKITDALGNLVATDFGDFDLGISLRESDLAPGAVSAYVLYYDKDKEKLEDGKDIEFGPIWVEDPKVISNISFDKLNSESGDMLLVNLSVISENDQYSSYYIFNKNMSRIDYLSFSNSTENTSVSLTRGDKTTFPDGNTKSPGSLIEATEKRVAMEKRFLEEVDKTYGIKREEVFQTIDDEKIIVGNFPKDQGKVFKMLTIENLTNSKNYPGDKGYFKIY